MITLHCEVCDKTPIYFNSTNLYTVARFINLQDDSIFSAVGTALPQGKKLSCFLRGDWTTSAKYGVQFHVVSWEEDEEDTVDNCYNFLSSGLIKGVGEKTAQKIVDRFGVDSLKILETTPEQLFQISGITQKKLNTIIDSYADVKHKKKVVALSVKYGISLRLCLKIYDKFKGLTDSIIATDTYRLCEVDGIGFMTADKIARNQDPAVLTSNRRYFAVAKYIMEQNFSSGSLYMPIGEFKHSCAELFNVGLDPRQEAQDIYEKLMGLYSQEFYISPDMKLIGLISVFQKEKETAQCIISLIKASSSLKYSPNSIDFQSTLKNVMTNNPSLSDEQIDAIKMVMTSNVSIITGGAGTGKTTVLQAILDAYEDEGALLLAPTGRASRRMAEVTGHDAYTIHSKLRLLTSDSGMAYDESNIQMLRKGLIIVDEVSMLDYYIAHLLFTHIRLGSKVVFIGDINQLPSVGPGNVLRELLNSSQIPVCYLTFNFRQANNNLIAINANRVLNSDTEFEYAKKEVHLIDAVTESVAETTLVELYRRAVAKLGFENVALITPFRKNFKCGANSLNKTIQSILNPSNGQQEVPIGDEVLRVGDRVMQTKNRPYAMNGDVGTITKIEETNKEELISTILVAVKFDDYSEEVIYDNLSIDELCLAYAMTVHKAQGSEYKAVLLAFENNSNLFLTKNLVYTAFTRARDQLVIVGQKEVLKLAVIRDFVSTRYSFLGKLIYDLKKSG